MNRNIMKKNRKVKIAGLAMILGIVSTAALARPSCDDLRRLCAEGNIVWCNMLANDPSCL